MDTIDVNAHAAVRSNQIAEDRDTENTALKEQLEKFLKQVSDLEAELDFCKIQVGSEKRSNAELLEKMKERKIDAERNIVLLKRDIIINEKRVQEKDKKVEELTTKFESQQKMFEEQVVELKKKVNDLEEKLQQEELKNSELKTGSCQVLQFHQRMLRKAGVVFNLDNRSDDDAVDTNNVSYDDIPAVNSQQDFNQHNDGTGNVFVETSRGPENVTLELNSSSRQMEPISTGSGQLTPQRTQLYSLNLHTGVSIQNFICVICRSNFRSAHGLNVHIGRVHKGQKRPSRFDEQEEVNEDEMESTAKRRHVSSGVTQL